MMQGFAGRVAIVTGSGQGIGEAIARRLASGGAYVVLNDVMAERVERAAAEIQEAGHQASYHVSDIATGEGADHLVEHAMNTYGRLDILVNNAGIAKDRYLAKMTDEEWDSVIRVNLSAQFLTCRAAARIMIDRKYGRIINIASRAWLGGPGQANYSASKGGVVSLTRTLALELGKFQITANAVAPGLIDTPLFRNLQPEVQERLAKTVPVQRVGTPEEVADAVAFFADDGAGYLNGQLLYVCGGRSVGSY
ncbi:MAG: SDR family NAD(P)-dependent oxidoreductase [Thermaerobacter sp.]|nr:SDR family NAD(P)-dependent oxidoreductase [Thermaerobacter sp.]